MGLIRRESLAIILLWLTVFEGCSNIMVKADINYKEALTKSLIFLEAQRSGKLPPNNRVPWRGDSALDDGSLANVDLSGGYYDAGDNVKYGFPLAFTVTTLAWAAVYFKDEITAAGEMKNVEDAIKWGTDYLLKCASRRNRLYVQVGDPEEDHHCWVRPEKMKTKRTVLHIGEGTPGTEIAAETSAAFASSSIVFRTSNRVYSRRLLNKAKIMFNMAKSQKGTYDGECPFYCSFSGYNDELLWAATWLYVATKKPLYLKYIQDESISAYVNEFSWDLKYAGAQVMLTRLLYEGIPKLDTFKYQADSFICSNHPQSPYSQITLTPGGLIHLRDGANTQYVTGTAMIFIFYGDILEEHKQTVTCGAKNFTATDLYGFAKNQMDYILGKNPEGRSVMVGFGDKPPLQAHHRGASVPMADANLEMSCAESFARWLQVDRPNPNELTGAILGGQDKTDHFDDKRTDSAATEPCTYVNSLAVGPLAKLAFIHKTK